MHVVLRPCAASVQALSCVIEAGSEGASGYSYHNYTLLLHNHKRPVRLHHEQLHGRTATASLATATAAHVYPEALGPARALPQAKSTMNTSTAFSKSRTSSLLI